MIVRWLRIFRAWGFVCISYHRSVSSIPPSESRKKTNMSTIITLGGRVKCTQCRAMSKRSRLRCRGPAMHGKNVCRMHGSGNGPRTLEGKARISAAQLVHGRETRQGRLERSQGLARLAELEALGRSLGVISGPLTRGPKPGGR